MWQFTAQADVPVKSEKRKQVGSGSRGMYTMLFVWTR